MATVSQRNAVYNAVHGKLLDLVEQIAPEFESLIDSKLTIERVLEISNAAVDSYEATPEHQMMLVKAGAIGDQLKPVKRR